MKIYNAQNDNILRPSLAATLQTLRDTQAFDASGYALAKAQRLNDYLRSYGLKSCVVAVSGGIDSAVVLGIAALAQRQEDSPLERIVPVLLPVLESTGATNQASATVKGQEVARAFGMEPKVVALSKAHQILKSIVDQEVGGTLGPSGSSTVVVGEDWAAGQLVSYLRTPALYYVTSLLTQTGQPGVLLGTTNKDEGAYLGYFGKASDGLVDVQLISDLHKSEVFALGRELGVPSSVLTATPTGDMYDGRSDEEVFGAPYDFVELFLRFKYALPQERTRWAKDWDADDVRQFYGLSDRLERMHQYNKHKYLGKSPAVHLDLWDCKIEQGWDYFVYEPLGKKQKGAA